MLHFWKSFEERSLSEYPLENQGSPIGLNFINSSWNFGVSSDINFLEDVLWKLLWYLYNLCKKKELKYNSQKL